MTERPRRSALYLPANNAKALAKARTLPCDIVILDLEDSVAPEAKEEARAAAVAALDDGGFGNREVAIRTNGLDTQWGADDMAAVSLAQANAVLVPKVSSPADIDACQDALSDAAPEMQLWAMIETCPSMFALEAIAAKAAMCAGPVPQQPPRMLIQPWSTKRSKTSAMWVGVSW